MTITINKKLANKLGFDTVRELMTDFGQWLYYRDFTGYGYQENRFDLMWKQYVKQLND